MTNNILIIDGHPDPDRARFGHALANAYLEGARATGKSTRLITLADADFPLLRTAQDFARPPEAPAIIGAREDMLWADHIVFVFPLWLGGAPALMHAFFEQVARASFVAEMSGSHIRQRLKGKSARLIVTMGMPAFIYRLIFHAHGVKSIVQGILGFGGVHPVRLTLFGAVEAVGEHEQKRRLARVAALGREGG